MTRYTKELRQEILKDFLGRHDGIFEPDVFVREVRDTGPSHPAFSWFEFDIEKAASQHWIDQARDFVRDLRIRVEVQEVRRSGSVNIRVIEMPMVQSELEGRANGGGYRRNDPDNPEHMVEFCREAERALEAWLRRYRSAWEHVGGSLVQIEVMLDMLNSAGGRSSEAA